MIQAKFILNFDYTINGASVNGSLEENYTFSNLSAATNYYIVGKVITSDNVNDPLKNHELRNTKTSDGQYIINSFVRMCKITTNT